MDRFSVDPKDTAYFKYERRHIDDLYADGQITDKQYDQAMTEIDNEEFGYD